MLQILGRGQRWSRGHKGRGQEHKKKSQAKAKDSPTEDRPSRGQDQECSTPRPRTKDTSASVLQKKKTVFKKFFLAISKKNKNKGLQKNFQAFSCKKRLPKFFSGDLQNFNNSKKVLSSSRGQGNFRGLEASRPRPRIWPSRPRPRTSKCVFEDSTSGRVVRTKVGSTVRYVQNLNIAYFKNLSYRTNVYVPKKFLHAYCTYVLFIGWYPLNGWVNQSSKRTVLERYGTLVKNLPKVYEVLVFCALKIEV